MYEFNWKIFVNFFVEQTKRKAKYTGSFQSSTKDRAQRAVKDASFHDRSALSTCSSAGRFAGLLRRRKRDFCPRCLEFFFLEYRLRERRLESLPERFMCCPEKTEDINLLTYSSGTFN